MPEDDLPADLDPRRASNGIRIVRIVCAVLAFVLLAGSGTAYVMLNRFSSQAGNLAGTDIDGNSDKVGNPEAINILVVGNDSREGYTEEQLAQLSTTAEESLSTDSIMLIHVPAEAQDDKQITVMSFPRDSYVAIPGYGKGKINSAYALGYTEDAPENASQEQRKAAGQNKLVQTVSSLSGMKIDNFVEVSLLGFYNLTNSLGGIDVNLCEAVEDDQSGINLPAGKQTLDGKQALSFVRQRHGLTNGDLDRVKRQQYFFGAVIRKVLDMGLLDSLNFGKLTDIIDSLAGTITYDQNLDPLEFAEQMRYIAAGNVQFTTIPLAAEPYGTADGEDIVVLASKEELSAFFNGLDKPAGKSGAAGTSSKAPATVDPSKVTLDVYNGTTTEGAAATAAEQLTSQGFNVDGTLSASTTDYTESVVQYPEGMEDEANTVAAAVPGSKIEEHAEIEKIILVIGANYPGLGGDEQQTTEPAAPTETAAPDKSTTAADEGCIY